MLPCQIQFARLSRVIERCDAAIAREQKITLTIMREEHSKYTTRMAQRRHVAKLKAGSAS